MFIRKNQPELGRIGAIRRVFKFSYLKLREVESANEASAERLREGSNENWSEQNSGNSCSRQSKDSALSEVSRRSRSIAEAGGSQLNEKSGDMNVTRSTLVPEDATESVGVEMEDSGGSSYSTTSSEATLST